MSHVLKENMSKKLDTNLSFAGCGFLGIYHVGVGVCFKKFASHLLIRKISGASAGAIVACALLLDLPLAEIASEFFNIVADARSHTLGPFSPSFSIQKSLLNIIERNLPIDAHQRVTGRLHISLTRVFDGKNIVVSQFNSRQDVIDALACSCFIPGFSGFAPPKFHGVRYIDGAFSDNLVILNDKTVTVSPFCGETDISPKDESSYTSFHISLCNTSMEFSAQNARRLVRALLPPPLVELSNICRQGFNDALDFLYHNDLISCGECSLTQMNFLASNSDTFKPACVGCKDCRENSINTTMPEHVVSAFSQNAEGTNSWLTQFCRTAALPMAVPCSIANNFLQKIPQATETIYNYRRSLTESFHQKLISSINGMLLSLASNQKATMPKSVNTLNAVIKNK